MRIVVIMMSLVVAAGTWATAASARERAAVLLGQYATEKQCAKLRKIEAGEEAPGVASAPELLTADGLEGWEGGCRFTKIFEHEPGRMWLALMICSEGPSITPATYVFIKEEDQDAFEVRGSDDLGDPELYTRCDARKGNE